MKQNQSSILSPRTLYSSSFFHILHVKYVPFRSILPNILLSSALIVISCTCAYRLVA
jgi:hypothetical protein